MGEGESPRTPIKTQAAAGRLDARTRGVGCCKWERMVKSIQQMGCGRGDDDGNGEHPAAAASASDDSAATACCPVGAG